MAQIPSEEQLLALKGKQIPLRELLTLFGTNFRNDQTILIIAQALKDAGLATLPYFGTCGSQSDLHVVTLDSASVAEPAGEDGEEPDGGLSLGALPNQPFRIGDIPAAHNGIDSVTSGAQLTAATYIMSTKNYSQLPVLEDPYTLTGVVTWRSVARMYADKPGRSLADAIEDDPPVVQAHQDFFSLLPMISEHGYVLVRANNGRFTGIVTASDITHRFDVTARPFFVVGEIEFRLRQCLGAKIDPEAIRAVQHVHKTGQIADLMFGDYVRLLKGDQNSQALSQRADQNWAALGWGSVNRIQFVHQLDRVRVIRNKIAHFDPEPLPKKLSNELRQFVVLLRQLA